MKRKVAFILILLIWCGGGNEKNIQNQKSEEFRKNHSAIKNILTKNFILIFSTATIMPAITNAPEECIREDETKKIFENCKFSPFVFSASSTSSRNTIYLNNVSIYIEGGPTILENGYFEIETISNKFAIYRSEFETTNLASGSKNRVSVENIILAIAQENEVLKITINTGENSKIEFEDKILGGKIEIKGKFSLSILSGNLLTIDIEGNIIQTGCIESSAYIKGENIKANLESFFQTWNICPVSGEITVDGTKTIFQEEKFISDSFTEECKNIDICP